MKKILISSTLVFLFFTSKSLPMSKVQIKEFGGHRVYEVEYENDKDTVGSLKVRLADFLGVSPRDVILILPKVALKDGMKDIESLSNKSVVGFSFKLDISLKRIKNLEDEAKKLAMTLANLKKNFVATEFELSRINKELESLRDEKNQPRYE